MDGGQFLFSFADSFDKILDVIRDQPKIINAYNVLLTFSWIWLASGPVLALILSLYAHSFTSWMARRRGVAQLNENGELASEPFLQFSRTLFAVYSIFGMIILPTFIYYVVGLAFSGEEFPDPFLGVLLINFISLVMVFGWGLLCHSLASGLRALFDRRQ